MSEVKEVGISQLAKDIEVNEMDFRRLLMGIGLAQINNEAQRHAAIENWNNQGTSVCTPTLKNIKSVVQDYMGEAIRDGHIKMR